MEERFKSRLHPVPNFEEGDTPESDMEGSDSKRSRAAFSYSGFTGGAILYDYWRQISSYIQNFYLDRPKFKVDRGELMTRKFGVNASKKPKG